jgi:hypothetical protein
MMMRVKLFTAALAMIAGASAVAVSGASALRPVYINCYPVSSSVAFPAFLPRQHPSLCHIYGEPENEAHHLGLARAHWSHWGTSSATASGRALNNHPGMGGPASVPVQVRLYRIRRGCNGRLYYTRVEIKRGSSTGTLRVTAGCKSIPQKI